jgi:hypothetical protein
MSLGVSAAINGVRLGGAPVRSRGPPVDTKVAAVVLFPFLLRSGNGHSLAVADAVMAPALALRELGPTRVEPDLTAADSSVWPPLAAGSTIMTRAATASRERQRHYRERLQLSLIPKLPLLLAGTGPGMVTGTGYFPLASAPWVLGFHVFPIALIGTMDSTKTPTPEFP